MKQKERESDIQHAIIQYLRLKKYIVLKFRSIGIMKPNGSYIPMPQLEKGTSDIIACSPKGQFIAIEVKSKGNTPTSDQTAFLERIRANNGVAVLAYSLDDVMKIL